MHKFFKNSLLIGIIGIVICIVFYVTDLFSKLICPLLLKAGVEGASYYFVEEVLRILPLFFLALFAIYIIVGIIYLNRSHDNIEKAASKKLWEKNAAKQVVLDEKVDFLKHRYYSNCPNCGSVRDEDERECRFCGASLIISRNHRDEKQKTGD
ncbi:MAG: hypothetical protein J6U54_23275 [Clostridiales bacterium]|nr:hypothetical protein [Clostridiales bacterium]